MKVSTRAEQGILKKLQYVVVIDSPYLQPQTPYATWSIPDGDGDDGVEALGASEVELVMNGEEARICCLPCAMKGDGVEKCEPILIQDEVF